MPSIIQCRNLSVCESEFFQESFDVKINGVLLLRRDSLLNLLRAVLVHSLLQAVMFSMGRKNQLKTADRCCTTVMV